jgi:hypothetical protein
VQGLWSPIFGIHDILGSDVIKKMPPSTPWCISYKTMGIWFGCTYYLITLYAHVYIAILEPL